MLAYRLEMRDQIVVARGPALRKDGRGFSILEALISAVVLGIALMGVIQLHASSIRGTEQAEDIGRAAEIARQFADRVSMGGALPSGCGVPAGPPGCRLNFNQFSDSKSTDNPPIGPCSVFVLGDAIPDTSGAVPSVGEADGWDYRIDTVVSPGNGTATLNIDVYVCWRGLGGVVNETRTTRVRVDGIM